MDERTLQALKDSIAKWEKNARIRKPGNAQMGSEACPLCNLFNTQETRDLGEACVGCPVRQRVEYGFCEGTPYIDAERAIDNWMYFPAIGYGQQFRKAARAEADFLKSLLPEGQS